MISPNPQSNWRGRPLLAGARGAGTLLALPPFLFLLLLCLASSSSSSQAFTRDTTTAHQQPPHLSASNRRLVSPLSQSPDSANTALVPSVIKTCYACRWAQYSTHTANGLDRRDGYE